jgi:hypothetical protein
VPFSKHHTFALAASLRFDFFVSGMVLSDAARIAELNDHARQTFTDCRVCITPGIQDYPVNRIGELMPWAYRAMDEEQKADTEAKNVA